MKTKKKNIENYSEENYDKNKAIIFDNVSVNYKFNNCERRVLDNVNFEVKYGEFLSILGSSGCGKSTILSLISGLTKPTKGKVLVENKEANLKNNIGYMFQNDHLLEWRNIEENVMLGLEIKKKITKENKEYALELLSNYGLASFLDYKPREISGGMRQRVALVRTLAIKPKILLLDEPFSALDPTNRNNLSRNVKNLSVDRGITIIFVTHNTKEAEDLSDKIIFLCNKKKGIEKINEIC